MGHKFYSAPLWAQQAVGGYSDKRKQNDLNRDNDEYDNNLYSGYIDKLFNDFSFEFSDKEQELVDKYSKTERDKSVYKYFKGANQNQMEEWIQTQTEDVNQEAMEDANPNQMEEWNPTPTVDANQEVTEEENQNQTEDENQNLIPEEKKIPTQEKLVSDVQLPEVVIHLRAPIS